MLLTKANILTSDYDIWLRAYIKFRKHKAVSVQKSL
jgi:hypothetical protein